MRIAFARATQIRTHALLKGIVASGDELVSAGEPAHAAVCQWWGDAVGLYARGYRRVLVCELGHLGDRGRSSSLSWDGSGLHAVAPERPEPPLEAWRGRTGSYALLLGQVPFDWAVRVALEGEHYGQWLSETRSAVTRLTGLPVRVREHPELACLKPTPGNRRRPTLREELEGARIAVTLNSTSAVEAVCMGVPTVVLDRRGCMASSVSAEFGGPWHIEPANRRAWVNRLARLQWTLAELESGEAWRAVRDMVAADLKRQPLQRIA
jgi:hypothetical protein